MRIPVATIKELMLLLIANDAPLGPEWLDHPLKGDWADHRACHVGGDFLLIYQVDGEAIVCPGRLARRVVWEVVLQGKKSPAAIFPGQ